MQWTTCLLDLQCVCKLKKNISSTCIKYGEQKPNSNLKTLNQNKMQGAWLTVNWNSGECCASLREEWCDWAQLVNASRPELIAGCTLQKPGVYTAAIICMLLVMFLYDSGLLAAQCTSTVVNFQHQKVNTWHCHILPTFNRQTAFTWRFSSWINCNNFIFSGILKIGLLNNKRTPIPLKQ